MLFNSMIALIFIFGIVFAEQLETPADSETVRDAGAGLCRPHYVRRNDADEGVISPSIDRQAPVDGGAESTVAQRLGSVADAARDRHARDAADAEKRLAEAKARANEAKSRFEEARQTIRREYFRRVCVDGGLLSRFNATTSDAQIRERYQEATKCPTFEELAECTEGQSARSPEGSACPYQCRPKRTTSTDTATLSDEQKTTMMTKCVEYCKTLYPRVADTITCEWPEGALRPQCKRPESDSTWGTGGTRGRKRQWSSSDGRDRFVGSDGTVRSEPTAEEKAAYEAARAAAMAEMEAARLAAAREMQIRAASHCQTLRDEFRNQTRAESASVLKREDPATPTADADVDYCSALQAEMQSLRDCFNATNIEECRNDLDRQLTFDTARRCQEQRASQRTAENEEAVEQRRKTEQSAAKERALKTRAAADAVDGDAEAKQAATTCRAFVTRCKEARKALNQARRHGVPVKRDPTTGKRQDTENLADAPQRKRQDTTGADTPVSSTDDAGEPAVTDETCSDAEFRKACGPYRKSLHKKFSDQGVAPAETCVRKAKRALRLSHVQCAEFQPNSTLADAVQRVHTRLQERVETFCARNGTQDGASPRIKCLCNQFTADGSSWFRTRLESSSDVADNGLVCRLERSSSYPAKLLRWFLVGDADGTCATIKTEEEAAAAQKRGDTVVDSEQALTDLFKSALASDPEYSNVEEVASGVDASLPVEVAVSVDSLLDGFPADGSTGSGEEVDDNAAGTLTIALSAMVIVLVTIF